MGVGHHSPGFSYTILIIEGGLMVLFFGLVFPLAPLHLEIFLLTPLQTCGVKHLRAQGRRLGDAPT